MIKKEMNKAEQVAICHKNTCLNATGLLAEAITAALVAAILLVAAGSLLKSIK
jgi:hypothetical protein